MTNLVGGSLYGFGFSGQKVYIGPAKQAGISAQDKHEVAMAAAHAAARIHQFASDNVGADVAAAYLQAYEAVEGWTKPAPQEKFNQAKYEEELEAARVEAFKRSSEAGYQAATAFLPKDA